LDIEFFLGIIFFIYGAAVGSFLNVCIVRWPQDKSVVNPPSHCPKCGKTIRWTDNIPLISYFVLRGRCRDCGEKFSFRYVFVEFLTACIFVVFYKIFGLSWLLLPYLVMLCCFIVATFVDLQHRIIPDEVSVGGMFLGFIFSFLFPGLQKSVVREELLIVGTTAMAVVLLSFGVQIFRLFLQKVKLDRSEVHFVMICIGLVVLQLVAAMVPAASGSGAWALLQPRLLSLAASIQGALIGGGMIYCMGLGGEMIFKKEAMGGGDVKLLAMVGAFLGWKLAALTFFIAPFFGAVVGIIEKMRTKDSSIAYGPYLVLGAIISMFWGEPIIRWLVNGYRF
jgi:leader peptidase (prepilin peptidase) / N-methyltransferase